MQAWYHCGNVYPFVPQEVLDRAPSVRASLPNKYCDPKISADLFEECLDEHLLCDELGINVVSIEHHSGVNSLYGASPMILGILARQTKKVRILSLGTLITIRPDPVRVAEEYATADVISRGRLEIGFVKSGDSEMVSGNANPVGFVDRFWEAMDVIKLALTSHDGPVSFEGKHFTHRHINLWPGPYQRPHPRFWAATGDRARHPRRRQPGHGLQADHGHLRQGRRFRAFHLHRPLGLPHSRGGQQGHPADGQGGPAAPAGRDDHAGRRRSGARRRAITPT